MNDPVDRMPALILAGGKATRLRPITDRIPKALVELDGQPFLWHQLRLLKLNGIRRVVLAVGYLGELIQKRFGDGSDLGISLEYSFDGPVLLGTGGAIRKALSLLPEQFFVIYGDSYLPCDYRAVEEAFRHSGASGLMTVYRNEGLFDASNVEFDGARIIRYDKRDKAPAMRHIDYGLGAFQRRVFASIVPEQTCDLEDVYQALLATGDLASFEVHERFYEIGSPKGLQETEEFLKSRANQ
jgi:NDP-sugar pyrophosphorylase family protein